MVVARKEKIMSMKPNRSEEDFNPIIVGLVFVGLLPVLAWDWVKFKLWPEPDCTRPSEPVLYRPFSHAHYHWCWKCCRFFQEDRPVHVTLQHGMRVTDKVCHGCKEAA
jgi:hypothetical protein